MTESVPQKKQRFCATGEVDLSVWSEEIEGVTTVKGALRKAKQNRGGLQNVRWIDGNWESNVKSICIVDCDSQKVLECE